jgi:hypothetical protein
MSHLRKIMQKLAQNEPDLLRAQAASSGSTDLMRQHMDAYEQRLATCTSPMLQYEWAWLEDHISSLELCLSQPEMLATAGGKHQVEEHLLESQRCQEALLTLMRKRGVDPSRHGHAVVIGEHAWEISQASIRGCWGID